MITSESEAKAHNHDRRRLRQALVPLLALLTLLAAQGCGLWVGPGTCPRLPSFSFEPPWPGEYRKTRFDLKYTDPQFIPQWTPDGSKIVFAIGDKLHSPPEGKLYVVNSDGSGLRRLNEVYGERVIHHTPRLSPDGSRVAYSSYGGGETEEGLDIRHFGIQASTLDGSQQISVPREAGALDYEPVWSPDGTRIAFLRSWCEGYPDNRPHKLSVLVATADGTEISEVARYDKPYPNSIKGLTGLTWSPDGRSLAYTGWNYARENEDLPGLDMLTIYLTDPAGETSRALYQETKILDHQWQKTPIALSPDGTKLASVVRRNTRLNLLLTDMKSEGTREWADLGVNEVDGLISARSLTWAPDSSALLFSIVKNQRPEEPLASVIYTIGIGEDKPIEIGAGLHAGWSPDGKKIAIVIPAGFDTVLYSTTAQGADIQRLVERNKDERPPRLSGAYSSNSQLGEVLSALGDREEPESPEATACTNGRTIPNPAINFNLINDCRTLLRVKNALTQQDSLNWNDRTPIQEWEGIVLAGDMSGAKAISLPGRNMAGILSEEVAQLKHLEKLNLSGNSLTGPIPPELGRMTNLKVLNLSGNSLVGSIPEELGNLTNLRTMTLSGNLEGTIPETLGRLDFLQELWIQGNFDTRIPREVWTLHTLRSLRLEGILQGTIPREVTNLRNLQELSLNAINRDQPIPQEVGSLTNLESLKIYGGTTPSRLPPELGALSRLKTLEIRGAQLTGPIPSEIGNLQMLETLDLRSNELTGGIPIEVAQLPHLTEVRIDQSVIRETEPKVMQMLDDKLP